MWTISPVTPDALTRTVQDFLSEASGAVVLENGAVAFDLSQSKYSISGEYDKCLLHFWSSERNTVRRVLDAEVKNGTLKLFVQRLGQAHPTKLEICRERDRRSPTAKKVARTSYEQKLRRALDRHFPAFTIIRLTTAVDLEKSFGPIYARGLVRHGGDGCLAHCERILLAESGRRDVSRPPGLNSRQFLLLHRFCVVLLQRVIPEPRRNCTFHW